MEMKLKTCQIDGRVKRELIGANLVSCLRSAGLDQCSFALIRASGTRNRLTCFTGQLRARFTRQLIQFEWKSVECWTTSWIRSADYSAINLIRSLNKWLTCRIPSWSGR